VFGIAISKIKSAILNQIIKNESFEIVLFFKKKKKLRFENVKNLFYLRSRQVDLFFENAQF
jgi:hypothetical protein